MTSGAAAGRYARALFDVAVKEGANLEQVQRDLQQFVDLFAEHPSLGSTLGNPAIPASKKQGVAKALVERAGAISPVVAKLMLMLAERDRLMLLPDIARIYGERLMDHQKMIRGEVTTAIALAPEKLRAARAGAAAGDRPQGRARSESRSVDHRRRRSRASAARSTTAA